MTVSHSDATHDSTHSPVLWREALDYFRSRSPIVFLSYCRFWESHGFVQQSLARELVENGVDVIWYDGAGWRRHEPHLEWTSRRLSVRQLWELPGRRLAPIAALNGAFQYLQIRPVFEAAPRALVWVQGGTEERLAKWLPHIDVFSTFDDPNRHPPGSVVASKAAVVVCQNSHALRLFEGKVERAIRLLPPTELPSWATGVRRSDDTSTRPVLGYIGSFFSRDYDLELLENLVERLPEYDFLLMGRTDPKGLAMVKERLSGHPNFRHHPWVPREHAYVGWKRIDLTLLLYRECREQEGAFPIKVLEAFALGKPCVATRVRKTEDLEGHVPRAATVDELEARIREQLSGRVNAGSFHHFRTEMDPKTHLIRVFQELTTSRDASRAPEKAAHQPRGK